MSPWLSCAWMGSTARAELGVEGSRGHPLLPLSHRLSQEAAQGWGCWGLQHKRIHRVRTLSDSLGAVSPPSPHRAAGFPLPPQQVSPSRSRPQTCSFLHTAPPEGPTGGDGLQAPQGHLCPIPSPRMAAHRVTHRVLSPEPTVVVTCGGGRVQPPGSAAAPAPRMGFPGPEGPS